MGSNQYQKSRPTKYIFQAMSGSVSFDSISRLVRILESFSDFNAELNSGSSLNRDYTVVANHEIAMWIKMRAKRAKFITNLKAYVARVKIILGYFYSEIIVY